QQRAIDDVLQDLSAGRPMNRLIQGDVGSGKTMVAAAAAFCTIQNRQQAAVMVPTEILAEQHYESLGRLMQTFGIRTVLLTSSATAPQKRKIKAQIADGTAQLIIGTQALFTEDVTFANLGLVVADEQHRFGVAQRSALSQKGDAPHLLVMSATPIPRTLALIAYGELDISVIGELPPGRQTIDTFLVGEDMRKRINAFIRKQCELGGQVYIVCPAVEESELESLKSAQMWAQTLQSAVFPDLRVGLLHGKMKGAEKDAVMSAFSRHEIDILVSTTVIEVGVDVPNATLMVVENADRFGLSQLHQLRGRVGRGSRKSYCVLFSSNRNPDTLARLKALCETNDGFAIAQKDLQMRGPGDFFGSRQHGLPVFRSANLELDMHTLEQAQQAAADSLTGDWEHHDAFRQLKARVDALFETMPPRLN
ncbi:MAG: ATP-dependent DNA helicase RecG, partial [Oscillospiraceae bacterium]|nr:ATP-dependent DNA helicase RecG [Oscillospiraceae bacterium]